MLPSELVAGLPAAAAWLTGPDLVLGFANERYQQLIGVGPGPGEPLERVLPAVAGQGRVTHALIFTACYSRYQFVWLTYRQTTQAVIEGCEAAWAFFAGVFRTAIPDNMGAIVDDADSLEPRINQAFAEYAGDFGPKVRINCVTPGAIETEQLESDYGGRGYIDAVAATVPMGRMGLPADVAAACVFLASDAARFITGSNILVHGGGDDPPVTGGSTPLGELPVSPAGRPGSCSPA